MPREEFTNGGEKGEGFFSFLLTLPSISSTSPIQTSYSLIYRITSAFKWPCTCAQKNARIRQRQAEQRNTTGEMGGQLRTSESTSRTRCRTEERGPTWPYRWQCV